MTEWFNEMQLEPIVIPNEALHLSAQEETLLEGIFQNIENE